MSRLLHLDTVDSTNSYLKTHRADWPHGTVVYADCQTAGRGRCDRTWVSQAGGLYFSVLLKPPYNPFLSNLTQLMALSICQALEIYGLTPAIKWPNDVQVGGRKISGILSETVFDKNTLEAVVLGVGINVSQDGLENVGQPATSLKMLGVQTSRERVLENVLRFFGQGYPALCEKGFETIYAAYTKRFAALGKEITVNNGEKTIFGTAEGISPRGTLLMRTAQGQKEIYIGDILS
ncbi:MAG: biotin--[acetyl-CoA-carboxylase] ligase [Elusimicrobiaceae bacterium]|nr:biotin--[acetyl-CoA-carboxylase] ligase [Elusimicrobiaceae bacterium]